MDAHGKEQGHHRDMDVGELFEKYTVDEIRDIEKKTRQTIERKKEDLRQMVGERYRELIEAADTITDMKKSAENVTRSINRIQELCNNLKQSLVSSNKSETYGVSKDPSRKLSQQKLLYTSAVNLKLLMDMPEWIWSALDSKQCLLAARLYLLARHIYSLLQLDPGAIIAVEQFPVLARQWASVCHFKAAILRFCRTRLRDLSTSDEMASECLGSILLLEDMSVEQVFHEFLAVRLDAVQQMFASDTSVQSQVCGIICLIVTTIVQIYGIFYVYDSKPSSDETDKQVISCNLLITMLKAVTSKTDSGAVLGKDALSAVSQQYLSKAVVDFYPSTRHQLVPVSPQALTAESQQFLNKCTACIHDGLVKILSYVTTVKGLAAIRDELWTLLKNNQQLSAWDTISSRIIGRPVLIWSELASSVFANRVEELLRTQFDAAASTSKSQISKVLADLGNFDDKSVHWERDLSTYIWVESALDTTNNIQSLSSGFAGKTLAYSGALMMKAHGYTPAVQGLCRALDQKLKTLLDDASCYVRVASNSSSSSSPEIGPFNRYEDRKRVQDFVQVACQDCITTQLEYLNQQLSSSQQQLSETGGKDSEQLTICRVLLMARYANALCELCPNLQLCMSCEFIDDTSTVLIRSAIKKQLQSKTLASALDNPCWNELHNRLVSFSSSAFGVWVNHTSDQLISEFQVMLRDDVPQTRLVNCTLWDCVEIEEETEDDNKIKSTIRVPMQASWYVQTTLYNVCKEINQIGSQTIHSSSLTNLVHRLGDGILKSYEDLLSASGSNKISQARSLQLLFDLQFIMNILCLKDDSEGKTSATKRFLQISEKLESFIDPFDLDVFTPYMQNHLTRQTQRSTVLFGLLVPAERRSSSSLQNTVPTLATLQDQHNVLPLASCQTRFQLLPISMQTSSSANIQPVIQPPKAKTMLLPTTGAGSTSSHLLPAQPQRTSSSSFLEQMSTMWFSGGR